MGFSPEGSASGVDLPEGSFNKLDPNIEKKINKALRSQKVEVRLEGEVANALGDDVIGFQRKIDTPAGRVGELDVETSNYIIEVTNGKSSKTASEFEKYFKPPLNNDGKDVILYAPNLNTTLEPSIESSGVRIVRTLEELKMIVKN